MTKTKPAVGALGFPRIGARRELKFALETFWSGKSGAGELLDTAEHLRRKNWLLQQDKGIDIIPSNDFSLYDHVLDTAVMVGAIPDGYGWNGGAVSLETYFAMARGSQTEAAESGCGHPGHAQDITALEMTKWFDTNYHFMVPELVPEQTFTLTDRKPLDHYLEAKALGIETRPVILGPVTFLKLAKARGEAFEPLSLLDRLLPVYAELLTLLGDAGAKWVQIDEPVLVLDLSDEEREAFRKAYETLSQCAPKLMLATYFGGLGENLETALTLPVAGLHADLVRAPDQLPAIIAGAPQDKVLSLGVIDGRNVWRADIEAIVENLVGVFSARGGQGIEIAPSCSLLHVPIDVRLETELDTELKSWLSFATQKLDELVTLARGLGEGKEAIAPALAETNAALASREASARVHNHAVATRLATVSETDRKRKHAFEERIALQHERLGLPLFPTTTIGSFPQTSDVRRNRAAFNRGDLTAGDYDAFIETETEAVIRFQEDVGLDVLVHGEFERNDMVQYFGEQLSGFAFTKFGWVQSYGSRYVRPPIIFGDVERPKPMTVKWWQFAQSKTEKPVKGMLTGPVTILNWSFVRDDIPRSETCNQIALAIRDEVTDLEKAGAAIIQIDEAALREGLPLRRADWKTYLDWAVDAFRLAASGVADETQIHTHMCYSEFNDIIEAIAAMDADVISIETSRSKMELLDAFTAFDYPNEIGPGVYDIHSPRIPAATEMRELLNLAGHRLDARKLWVNPDCGLKTRGWEEVKPALVNMVEAAKTLRR